MSSADSKVIIELMKKIKKIDKNPKIFIHQEKK